MSRDLDPVYLGKVLSMAFFNRHQNEPSDSTPSKLPSRFGRRNVLIWCPGVNLATTCCHGYGNKLMPRYQLDGSVEDNNFENNFDLVPRNLREKETIVCALSWHAVALSI